MKATLSNDFAAAGNTFGTWELGDMATRNAADERLTSREAESRLALREKDWRKRKQQLDAAAAAVFLQDYLERPAETLSHGQKQWLEIGMLLIQDPELLMLDEPVAGMSVSERAKTAELLNRIIKDRSVLVIEHDMKFVEDIAHKVTVLHQGQILSEGTMEKVKNDPKVIEVYLGH